MFRLHSDLIGSIESWLIARKIKHIAWCCCCGCYRNYRSKYKVDYHWNLAICKHLNKNFCISRVKSYFRQKLNLDPPDGDGIFVIKLSPPLNISLFYFEIHRKCVYMQSPCRFMPLQQLTFHSTWDEMSFETKLIRFHTRVRSNFLFLRLWKIARE